MKPTVTLAFLTLWDHHLKDHQRRRRGWWWSARLKSLEWWWGWSNTNRMFSFSSNEVSLSCFSSRRRLNFSNSWETVYSCFLSFFSCVVLIVKKCLPCLFHGNLSLTHVFRVIFFTLLPYLVFAAKLLPHLCSRRSLQHIHLSMTDFCRHLSQWLMIEKLPSSVFVFSSCSLERDRP